MLLIMNKSIFDHNEANGYDMNIFLSKLKTFLSKTSVGTTEWDIYTLIRSTIHVRQDDSVWMTMRYCEAEALMAADMELPIHRIVYETFPLDESTESEAYWHSVMAWDKGIADAALLYAKSLKTYRFHAYGNYSEEFGWDNGLEGTLGNQVLHEMAFYADYDWQCAGGNGYGLTYAPFEGVYADWDEYGGSRTANGYVIAPSRQRAEELMKAYCSGWAVTEYEPA